MTSVLIRRHHGSAIYVGGTCESCQREVNGNWRTLYRAYNPDTGALAWVCQQCEREWALCRVRNGVGAQ